MQLMLSDHDLGILLMGELMNSGYPFVFTQPYKTDAAEQQIVDAVVERYVHARRANHERQMFQPRPLDLSPSEATALIAILQACLAECRGNSTSIHLHLHAEDEKEVLDLMKRLRSLGGDKDGIVSFGDGARG
jgi:hypothetical protein